MTTLKNIVLSPLALVLTMSLSFGAVTASAAGPTLLVGLNPLTVTQNGPSATFGVTFANIRLDATPSNEDILVSRIPLSLNVGGGALASNLQNCRVVNANNTSLALNTGGNAMPSVNSNTLNTFVFDSPIRVPLGNSVVVSLICDIAATNAINNTYQFTVNPVNVTATSAITNSTVTPSAGQGVVVGNGVSVITTGGTVGGTVIPILPNTGAGGAAPLNIALILGALALLGAGIVYNRKLAS